MHAVFGGGIHEFLGEERCCGAGVLEDDEDGCAGGGVLFSSSFATSLQLQV